MPTNGSERTGYPTQKPEGVVRRIVSASSTPGGWCLDFFAGSGTLGAVCAALGRRCVLVDSNPQAVAVMAARLGATPQPRALISSKRFSQSLWRRLASPMNGEKAIAHSTAALTQRAGAAHRPHEVDEQHDPRAVGVVPGLVLEGVVEDHRLPSAQCRVSVSTRIPLDSAGSGISRPRW